MRVKIIDNPRYNEDANCQFPRDIRAVGRIYSAPETAISFARGSAGTVFYRVDKKQIKIEPDAPSMTRPPQIFDVGDDICVVCMDNAKTLVFIPCGHYCICDACNKMDRCPYCRSTIKDFCHRKDID